MPVVTQLQPTPLPNIPKLERNATLSETQDAVDKISAAVRSAVAGLNDQLQMAATYSNAAGGHKGKGVTVDMATYAVASTDGSLFFDSHALNPVATLPQGLNYPDMEIMAIEEVAGGVSTLAAAAGDTIEGAASVVVTTGKRWHAYVQPSGATNWRKVLG